MKSHQPTSLADLPGLKRRDIQKCAGCHQGVAKGGPIIYRLRIERFVLDGRAIQQAAGLEMMIGPALSSIMGTDVDLAKQIDSDMMLVCGDCIIKMPMLLRDSDERTLVADRG